MTAKKIKVLLVVPDLSEPIGILAQNIVNTCIDIDFYFFSGRGVHNRRNEFLNLIRHVDVVHFLSNISTLNLPSDINISDFSCPMVASIHHVESGDEVKITKAAVADVIHVISKEWLSFVQERTDRPVHLAHLVVSLNNFNQNSHAAHPHDPFRIGSFGLSGTLNNRKRLDVLLDALSQLRLRNIPFELVVRGAIWSDLLDHFIEEGIPIRNLGYVSTDNLWQGYGDIDLYVCTSDIEGGPLTCLEALASSIPVVSTPVGIAQDALPFGGGLLVEKNNPSAFADAIFGLMTNRNQYDKLRSETQLVAARFSGAAISKEYVSLYESAIWHFQENNQCRWLNTPTLRYSPKRQREKELAYSHFQEAQLQKRLGYGFQSFVSLFRAVRNIHIPLRGKILGLLNYIKYN